MKKMLLWAKSHAILLIVIAVIIVIVVAAFKRCSSDGSQSQQDQNTTVSSSTPTHVPDVDIDVLTKAFFKKAGILDVGSAQSAGNNLRIIVESWADLALKSDLEDYAKKLEMPTDYITRDETRNEYASKRQMAVAKEELGQKIEAVADKMTTD